MAPFVRLFYKLLFLAFVFVPEINAHPAFHHFQMIRIRDMQTSGAVALQKILENHPPKRFYEKVLFAFDLDETLTNFAYRGSRAESGEVHLKPGIGDLFYEILIRGHRIGILTANVSKDVESFLMDELGFDYENEEDYSAFREFIRIKQPDLPLPLKQFEFLKRHKGRMLRELTEEFHNEGLFFDAVIYSDDKTGFHERVLNRGVRLPTVGLRVGHRPHYYGDLIGALREHNRVDAGTSLDFLKTLRLLLESKRLLASVVEHGQGSIFTHVVIQRFNEHFFQAVSPDSQMGNDDFGPWLLESTEKRRYSTSLAKPVKPRYR